MPRPSTGHPHWKALAVKLPEHTIEEVRRHADVHRMSISKVIREGLELLLHGPQRPSAHDGPIAIPSTTVESLHRLAYTLEDKIRIIIAGAMVPEEERRQTILEPTVYNSN